MKKSGVLTCLLLAGFILSLAYPLVKLLQLAFDGQAGSAFQHWRGVFSDSIMRDSVINSLTLSLSVALVATVLGLLLASSRRFLALPSPLKGLLDSGTQLPMFFPTLVYGFTLIYVFGRQGLLTNLMGGHVVIQVFGPQGIFLGLLIYCLPITFMLLNDAIAYLDPKVLVASQLMGDSRRSQLWVAFLRPLVPALALSVVQTFFLSFTDFGLPIALASNYPLLATTLYTRILGALPNLGQGAVIALIMLLPAMLSTMLIVGLQHKNKGHKPAQAFLKLKKGALPWLGMTTSSLLVSGMIVLFIPIFMVPLVVSYPYDMGLTLAHFVKVLTDPSIQLAIFHTLILAGLTALCGTVLSLTAAYLSTRSRVAKWASIGFKLMSNLTNAMPGMVLGVALMLVVVGTSLQSSLWILLLVNCLHLFATPFGMAELALNSLSPNLEATSRLMGDGFVRTLFGVILPNIRDTILEMLRYYFVNAMVTISAVIFLVGSATATVTTKMKELQNFNRYDQVFALAICLLVLNIGIHILLNSLKTKERRLK